MGYSGGPLPSLPKAGGRQGGVVAAALFSRGPAATPPVPWCLPFGATGTRSSNPPLPPSAPRAPGPRPGPEPGPPCGRDTDPGRRRTDRLSGGGTPVKDSPRRARPEPRPGSAHKRAWTAMRTPKGRISPGPRPSRPCPEPCAHGRYPGWSERCPEGRAACSTPPSAVRPAAPGFIPKLPQCAHCVWVRSLCLGALIVSDGATHVARPSTVLTGPTPSPGAGRDVVSVADSRRNARRRSPASVAPRPHS